MKIFTTFCLFLFGMYAAAQQPGSDTLYHRNDQDAAVQSRRMFIDCFRAGRLDSLRMLVDSIDRRNTTYLWPAERLLTYYWTEEYGKIDSLMWNFDVLLTVKVTDYPPDQSVWNVLQFHSQKNVDTLVLWIAQTDCSDSEFDARVELLEVLAYGWWDDQDSLNRMLSEFAGTYKTDLLHDGNHPTAESGKSVGRIAFGAGTGPAYVSGYMKDHLLAERGFVMDFSASHRKWCFSALIQVADAKLKSGIVLINGDVLQEGQHAYFGMMALTAGYAVADYRILKSNPFIGISYNKAGDDAEDDHEVMDALIGPKYTFTYGWNTEVKFIKLNPYCDLSLNVRISHTPFLFNLMNEFYSGRGGLLHASIGINIGFDTYWQ